MFPKAPSKLLLVLFVVALVCVLVVSGPVHVALHGDSPGDGCYASHISIASLGEPVLVPALETTCEQLDEPATAPLIEAPHAASSAPRAPPRG